MKKFIKLTALLLVLAISLFAAGCSAYDRLEKAFLENGFEITENIEDVTQLLKDDLAQGIREVEVYGFAKTTTSYNDFSVAFVFEFKSVKELTQAVKQSDMIRPYIDELEQDDDLDDIYEELVEDGYANGKYLIVSSLLSSKSAKQQVANIVKGACLISPDLF